MTNTATPATYAIRERYHYHAGTCNADRRWQLHEKFDAESYSTVMEFPSREAAEAAIPDPVHLPHGAYGCDFEVVRVGSRDHKRAARNSGLL